MAQPTPYYALQEVTRLNNEGVFCLANNQSKAAYSLFKAAITSINGILGSCSYDEGGEVSVTKSEVKSISITSLEDDLFYVHGQALSLDFGVLGGSNDALQWASTSVMFNMALSLHQYGMRYHAESNLRAAARLYGHCSRLVCQFQSLCGTDNDDLTALVAFAATNNQAQIHYRFLGDHQGARELLMQLAPANVVHIQSPYMDPALLDEIILNFYTIAEAGTVPSAAAA
jgi:hypothetical protein